jgi:hypothetical protein
MLSTRFRYPSFVSFLLAFVVMLLSNPTWAVNFQPVSPDELKMASEPKAAGAPAIILFRQVDRDDRGNTAHEDVYFRIKILTEEGRKYGDIEIPFWKEQSNIGNIHARTIGPNGTIVNFTGKAFDKSIVKARGVKYMAKTFTLPDVQIGSILEYYYTTDFSEHYVFDSHWILSNELFTKHAKFSLKPYTSDRLHSLECSLDVEQAATRHGATRGSAQPCDQPGSERYPGLPDGRLHAAGK